MISNLFIWMTFKDLTLVVRKMRKEEYGVSDLQSVRTNERFNEQKWQVNHTKHL